MSSRQISAVDVQPLANFIGYVVGNWYLPIGPSFHVSGANGGIGSIRLYPAFIKDTVTLSALGVRISTGSAGNVQAAIYANNAATGRPTGNPLASTASMATTSSATNVNAAVSVQLTQGLYWFATNIDNTGATLISPGTTAPFVSTVIGSATQSSGLSSGGSVTVGLSTPSTFGTWPDLTAATFTEVVNSATFGAVQIKVGSVP